MMNGDKARGFERHFRKAMDGLYALAELLEIADAKQPHSAGPLLTEHLLAIEALGVKFPKIG